MCKSEIRHTVKNTRVYKKYTGDENTRREHKETRPCPKIYTNNRHVNPQAVWSAQYTGFRADAHYASDFKRHSSALKQRPGDYKK